jgi:purine-cytosine permease-like protein
MTESPHHHLLEEIPGGAEELRKEVKHDYSSSHDGIVPLSVRRGTWTHHVPLWLTFYPGFAYMALGFTLYSLGFTLARMLLVVAISFTCYLLYAIPAAYMGATRGQTHSLLSRSIFGVVGSGLISVMVMIIPLGWVGYQSNLLASMWNGLYGWTPVLTIGIVIAVVGITNNVFGFTGISAFARWFAAPVTLLWLLYALVKALVVTPGHVISSHPAGSTTLVLGIVLAISFATYGNEPDVFRYAQPRLSACVPPLAIGLFVGQILLPTAGWIIAARVGSGDFGKVFDASVSFSLFGASILAFVLATGTQVAVNDANYYESLNAGQNLLGGWSHWRRIYTCLILAVVGGFMAWWVPQSLSNFFRITALLAVTVPSSTVIMYTDQLLLPRLLGIHRTLDRVPAWNEAARANWPAVIALVVAILFGSYVNGIFPGQDGSPLGGWGIGTVEAWVLGAVLYIALAAVVKRSPASERILGFPQTAIVSGLEPGETTAVEPPVMTGAS